MNLPPPDASKPQTGNTPIPPPVAPTPAKTTPATGTQPTPATMAKAAADQSSAGGEIVIERIRSEVGKIVVGQDSVLAGFLAALFADGHLLLEGVPGVAKTLLVKTLAATLSVETNRIQFTPDLMPSDVTGQLVYDQATSSFDFRSGPVFTNLLLADEINRTPPKTQAALLEVMEERQVTVGGKTRPLPEPFMVIATQNPVEYEGTYPLPEAQLDRFIAKIEVNYPSLESEHEVLTRHHRGLDLHDLASNSLQPVVTPEQLMEARDRVRAVHVEDSVIGYMTSIVRSTRTSPVVSLGVSPRGGVAILGLSKAWAWMAGRSFVTPDDVRAVTKPALRHRIRVQPEAELEGVTPDVVLDGLLNSVPAPR